MNACTVSGELFWIEENFYCFLNSLYFKLFFIAQAVHTTHQYVRRVSSRLVAILWLETQPNGENFVYYFRPRSSWPSFFGQFEKRVWPRIGLLPSDSPQTVEITSAVGPNIIRIYHLSVKQFFAPILCQIKNLWCARKGTLASICIFCIFFFNIALVVGFLRIYFREIDSRFSTTHFVLSSEREQTI